VELREEHLEGVERNDRHRHRRTEDQRVEQRHSVDRRLIASELRLNIDVIDDAEVRRDDASGRRHATVRDERRCARLADGRGVLRQQSHGRARPPEPHADGDSSPT